MASIFLSYSRKDAEKAESIAHALERFGHSVWWDREVEGGSRFAQKIEQALKGSEFVVVLWSRESVQSAWVQDEAVEGRDSDRLVPVLLDDSKPPLGFRQYQSIDLSRWNGRASARALKSIHAAILARTGGSAAGPAPAATKRLKPFSRRFVIALTAILALFVTGVLLWRSIPPRGATGGGPRVTLADFKSLSREVPRSVPDALRDELLAALATDAKILASTARSDGSAESDFVVKASIRKVENSVTFAVQLANARSGNTIWTASLEKPSSIIHIASRQVAVGVSQVLRCGLGGAANYKRPMPDQTLSLYLQYCEVLADLEGAGLNHGRAMDLARRLTDAAPDFSGAWSGFALQASLVSRSKELLNSEAVRIEAAAAARRALKLDKNNSEAYNALAILQPPFAHSKRERLHEQSISVRPSDCGCEYVTYGVFLSEVGRNADAAMALKRAHDMLPLQADVNSLWAEFLFAARHLDEAGRVADEVFGLWPDYEYLRVVIVRSAFSTGRYDQALKLLADPRTPVSDEERTALGMALQALRNGSAASRGRARSVLQALAQKPSANRSILIPALASLGGGTDSLALIEKALQDGKAGATYLLFEPSLESARRTPQFARIAQRYGLVAYWRETHRLPDFCKEADPPGLCRSL